MNDMPTNAPHIWDDVGQFIVYGIGIIMILALAYFVKLIVGSAGSDDDEDESKKD